MYKSLPRSCSSGTPFFSSDLGEEILGGCGGKAGWEILFWGGECIRRNCSFLVTPYESSGVMRCGWGFSEE